MWCLWFPSYPAEDEVYIQTKHFGMALRHDGLPSLQMISISVRLYMHRLTPAVTGTEIRLTSIFCECLKHGITLVCPHGLFFKDSFVDRHFDHKTISSFHSQNWKQCFLFQPWDLKVCVYKFIQQLTMPDVPFFTPYLHCTFHFQTSTVPQQIIQLC